MENGNLMTKIFFYALSWPRKNIFICHQKILTKCHTLLFLVTKFNVVLVKQIL